MNKQDEKLNIIGHIFVAWLAQNNMLDRWMDNCINDGAWEVVDNKPGHWFNLFWWNVDGSYYETWEKLYYAWTHIHARLERDL